MQHDLKLYINPVSQFTCTWVCLFKFVSEHRELMHQIDDTHDHKKRLDLKNELEQLVTRMEDKGAQITKLRKHQQMVREILHSFCFIQLAFGID